LRSGQAPSTASIAMAAGVALLVAGVVLLAASYVPIPYVEDAPRVETGATTTPSLVVVKVSLLNETFAVGAGKARAYCYRSFPPGTTLHIAVKVLSGGDRRISFLVMDEPEWRVFEAGGSPYHYAVPSRLNATEVRVTWNPPSDRQLCFVFDNKFSTASKTVHAEITASYEKYTYVTKTYTSTVYEPAIRYRTLGYLLAPGVLVLVAGAVLVIASWYASTRQKPAGAQH
jgi:hypothetical protein